MTKEEARIIILEDALRQAQNTVEFLHGCLTCENYSYDYPESTIRRLEKWKKLAPRICDVLNKKCYHSRSEEDCKSCQLHHKQQRQLMEAKMVLS